jgi:hypothetical protein
LIFNLYSRVLVKLGADESHVFDRGRLMFTEVAEIERVTGQSYAEWAEQLGKYSITAVAALLHILRKRDGQPSDFGSLQFNVADLDVVPLHDDGSEFTPAEVAADLTERVRKASEGNGADPTLAAVARAVAPETNPVTTGTSLSSPNGSGSGRGSGNGSPGPTSVPARRTSTRR